MLKRETDHTSLFGKPLLRVTASLTAFIFLWNQIVWAGEILPKDYVGSSPQPVATAPVADTTQATATSPVKTFTTTDFLSNGQGPLSPSTTAAVETLPKPAVSRDITHYDYERYDFQDALDLLRPEFATAVIVKKITVEDLRKLAELPFETGVIVLHGEIVLFTSGSESEIGILPAASQLIKKATFVSHTHTGGSIVTGPSEFDLAHAEDEEYVITEAGVYAYDRTGLLNDGDVYSYGQYIERLNKAVKDSLGERDQTEARKDLNQFIAAQDLYNASADREVFRMATPAPTIQNFYDTVGTLIRTLTTTYYEGGQVAATDDYRFTAGLKTARYYTSYDIAGVKTHYITTTYHPDGQTAKVIKDEYYTGTVKAGYNQATYSVAGVKTQDWNVTYYSNGTTVKTINDIRYLNNIRTYLYQTIYDSAGIKTHYITTTYHPDGQTAKVIKDEYYTGTVKAGYNQATYNTAGVKTQDYNVTYYSNGTTVKTIDEYGYTNSIRTYFYQTTNDSAGLRIDYTTTTYHPNGQAIKVFTDYSYAAGLKTGYSQVAYDAAGVKTQDCKGVYYSNGTTINTIDDYRYANNVRTYFYQTINGSTGLKTSYKATTYHPDGQAVKVFLDEFYASGMKTSSSQQTYTVAGVKTQDYIVTYYPNSTKIQVIDDIRYSNNVRTYLYQTLNDSAGVKTHYITTTYHPDGQTAKVVKDEYYTGAVKAGYNQATYSIAGVKTQDWNVTYYSNGATVKTIDDIRYSNNIRTYLYQTIYDSAGVKTHYITTAYQANGVAVKSIEDLCYAGSVKTQRYYTTCDAAGVRVHLLIQVFYTDGKIKSTDDYDYAGARLTKRVFKEYNPSGIETSSLTENYPPQILTNVTGYAVRYTVDGNSYDETISLIEGLNTVQRNVNGYSGTPALVEWKITLDTVPPEILFTSPSVTQSKNYTLTYTADGVSKTKSFTDLAEGENTLTVTETDLAGNTSTANWTLLVDSTPPEITFTSPQSSDTQDYTLTYTVDGVATDPEGKPYSSRWVLGNGSNKLFATFTDRFGKAQQKFFAVNWVAPASPARPQIDPLPQAGVLSVTDATGFILKKIGNDLVAIEKPGAYEMRQLVFNEQGDLTGGFLIFEDGTEVLYAGNKILWVRDPRGTMSYYNSDDTPREIVTKTTDAQGHEQTVSQVFSYEYNAQNQIVRTVVNDGHSTSVYDATGRIQQVFKADGSISSYLNGTLKTVLQADQTQITYNHQNGTLPGKNPGDPEISVVHAMLGGAAPLSFPQQITYDTEGNILEVQLQPQFLAGSQTIKEPVGKKIVFEGGVPMKVIVSEWTDPLTGSGPVTALEMAYDFQSNLLGEFTGFQINVNGTVQNFDRQGQLTSIELPEGSLSSDTQGVKEFIVENGKVVGIVLTNGTRVQAAPGQELDGANGGIQNGTVTLADHSRLVYENGELTQLIMENGLTYSVTKTGTGESTRFEAVLVSGGEGLAGDIIQKFTYDGQMNLIQTKSVDQEIVNYLDQGVTEIRPACAAGATCENKYFYRVADHVVVIEGPFATRPVDPDTITLYAGLTYSRSEYDLEGHPLSIQTFDITNGTGGQLGGSVTLVKFSYGKIRKIYQCDLGEGVCEQEANQTANYAYEFDSSNREITAITDLKTGDVRRYLGDRLISATTSDHVVTSYEYGSDGRMTKSVMTWQGRIQDTFAYAYDNASHLKKVTDSKGVTRIFDSEDILIGIIQGKKEYKIHHFEKEGEDLTAQELIRETKDDGMIYHYQMGKVTTLEYPDGTVVKDIIQETNGEIFSAIITRPNGAVERIINGDLVEIVRPDGSILNYENGQLVKVSDLYGHEKAYPFTGENMASFPLTLSLLPFEELATTLQATAAEEGSDLYKGKVVAHEAGQVTIEMPNGVQLIYKAGKLWKEIEPGTGNTREYEYAGQETIIHGSGNLMYFNQDKKLYRFKDYEGNDYVVSEVREGGAIVGYDLTLGERKVRTNVSGKVLEIEEGDVRIEVLESGKTHVFYRGSEVRNLDFETILNNQNQFKSVESWAIGSAFANNYGWGALQYSPSGTVAVDLRDMNGDGMPDRVWVDSADGSYDSFKVQINNGHGFNAVESWAIGSAYANNYGWGALQYSPSGTVAVDLRDMNGDGMPDRVWVDAVDGSYDSFKVQINTGHGFNAVENWAIGNPYANNYAWGSLQYSPSGALSVDLRDMNGDGLPDRVWVDAVDGSYDSFKVQINNGHGFNAVENWAIGNPYANNYAWGALQYSTGGTLAVDLRDMNGDGLPDRVWVDAVDGSYDSFKVQINNGHGFSTVESWAIGNEYPGYWNWGSIRGSDGGVYVDLRDMNGDGLPDRVWADAANGSYDSFRVQLNTGSGFGAVQQWVIGSEYPGYSTWGAIRADNDNTFVDLVDMNGDGLPDRVWRDQKDGSYDSFRVQLNTGSGFGAVQPWAVGSEYPGYSNWGSIRGSDGGVFVDLMDMNGDGLPDRVWRDQKDGSYDSFNVQLNQSVTFSIAHAEYLTAKGESYSVNNNAIANVADSSAILASLTRLLHQTSPVFEDANPDHFLGIQFALSSLPFSVSQIELQGTVTITPRAADASLSDHDVTMNGNAFMDVHGAKSGPAAAYFDGVGDSVSAEDSEDWDLGAGNFTIDLWTKFDGVPTGGQFIGQWDNTDRSFLLEWDAEQKKIKFYCQIDGETTPRIFSFDGTAAGGVWSHVALTRHGSDLRLFINGKQVGQAQTLTGSIRNAATQLKVGNNFKGWLDELKLSKGSARWTSDFDAEKTINLADEQTRLWLFKKDSAGDRRIRLVSQGQVDQLTGEEVSIKENNGNDWTYELGKLKTYIDASGNRQDFSTQGEYITVAERDTTYFYDAQGVLKKYSARDDQGLHTWELDPDTKTYTRHTVEDAIGLVLEERFDSQGRVIYEKAREEVGNSGFGDDLTKVGDTHLSGGSPLSDGGYSASFDGNGDYLVDKENDPAFDLGTGDFTIETRVNFEAVNQSYAIAGKYVGDGDGWIFYIDTASNYMALYDSGRSARLVYTGQPFEANRWYHLAVVRTGNVIKFFKDGVQQGSDQVAAADYNGDATPLKIGAYGSASAPLKGKMDELRISKGIARYTTNFTPSTTQFTADSNTALLLHFNKYDYPTTTTTTTYTTEGSNSVATVTDDQGILSVTKTDSQGRVIYEKTREEVGNGGFGDDLTKVGDTHLSEVSPLIDGESSASFDGAGDYLSIPDHADFDFGMGPFTVDAWVKFNNLTGDQYVVSLDNADNNASLRLSDSKFEFIGSTSGVLRWRVIGTTVAQLGKWYHIVGVRDGNLFKLFVDGVQEGPSASYTGAAVVQPQVFVGVEDVSHVNFVKGSIDEVRISKGIARWTSDFTPQTEPYTEDANTSLLLHFDKYDYATQTTTYTTEGSNSVATVTDDQGILSVTKTDSQGRVIYEKTREEVGNGGLGDDLTKVGDTHLSHGSPMSDGGSSASFDGTGDYLNVGGASDFNLGNKSFTIDTWAKFNNVTDTQIIAEKFAGSQDGYTWYVTGGYLVFYADHNAVVLYSANRLSANVWYHLAVVRDGNTFKLFINGKLQDPLGDCWVTTAALSNQSSPLRIGSRNGTGVFFNGQLDEFRVSQGTARWTSDFTPQTEPYTEDANTSLLLHFDKYDYATQTTTYTTEGSNSVATVTDDHGILSVTKTDSQSRVIYEKTRGAIASTDFGSNVTHVGNVRLEDVPGLNDGTQAAYFDGSGDYLKSISVSSDLNMSDLTYEAWVKWDGTTSGQIFSLDPWGSGFLFQAGDTIVGRVAGVNLMYIGFTPVSNVWYHYALMRSGSTVRLFVNGRELASGSNGAAISGATGFTIGARGGDYADQFKGWIRDLRISNVARYTSDFTPPTELYAKDANTALLLHFNKYNYATKTTTYTAEGSNSVATVTDDKGILSVTKTDSQGRVIYEKTRKEVGNGGFGDDLTKVGDTHLSEGSPLSDGGYSASFDGVGDYASIPDSDDWDLSGDATVDFYYQFNNVASAHTFVSQFQLPNSWDYWGIGYSSNALTYYVRLGQNSNGGSGNQINVLTAPFTPVVGQWYHIAFVRHGNAHSFYVDGVLKGTSDSSVRPLNYSAELSIGGGLADRGNTYSSNGQMDEFRISKGIARYTTNFTPSTTQFTEDANTALLLHFNKYDYATKTTTYTTEGSNSVVTVTDDQGILSVTKTDSQGRVIYEKTREEVGNGGFGDDLTKVGETHLSEVSPLIDGESCASFDGAGDYLNDKENDPAFDLGTGDFTIEAEVKLSTLDYGQTIASKYMKDGQGWIFLVDPWNKVLRLYDSGWTSVSVPISSVMQKNAWYHVAVVRQGNAIKFFINGVQQGSDCVAAANYDGDPVPLQIGAYEGRTSLFAGEMDELRISKGIARYTTNFTPQTTQFTSDSNTALLLHFNKYQYVEHQYARTVSQLPFTLDTKILSLNTRAPFTGPLTIRETGNDFTWPTLVQQPATKTFNLNHLAGDFNAGQTGLDEVVYSIFDKDGKLVYTQKMDQSLTQYENGHIRFVRDRYGRLVQSYEYDTEGDPIKITLHLMREEMPWKIRAAREKVEEEKAKALRLLAEQEQKSVAAIEAAFAQAREQLQAQRQALESQRFQKQCHNTLCWTTCETREVPGISEAIRQIDESMVDLSRREAQAYADLSAQITNAKLNVEVETQKAFAEVDRQEAEFKRTIIQQEISSIIFHYYRTILGRDPTEAEYKAWVSATSYEVGLDVTNLKNILKGTGTLTFTDPDGLAGTLNYSAEINSRQGLVSEIKTEVKNFLGLYKNKNAAGRAAMAADELDLPADLLIGLSAAEIDKIEEWIDSRGLHFGQSAFIALEHLMAQGGVTYEQIRTRAGMENFDREVLATKLILIDVLTGVITPFEESDLLISLYAMKHLAGILGVDTTGLKTDLDYLFAFYNSNAHMNAGHKIIAHIDGNHYVIVTDVYEEYDTDLGRYVRKVRYIDPGAGQGGDVTKLDQQSTGHQVMIVSGEEFNKVWEGVVLGLATTAQTIIQSHDADPNLGSRPPPHVLSYQELQKVRGSFFFLIIPFFVFIFSAVSAAVAAVVAAVALVASVIAGAIAAVIGVIGAIAGAIAGMIQAAIVGIVSGLQAIAGTFLGFAGSLLHAIPFVGAALSNVVGAVGAQFAAWGTTALGAIAAKFSVGAMLMGFVMSQGFEMVLVAIGVPPRVAHYISIGAQVVGAFFTGGASLAISTLASIAVQEFGPALGLSPVLTSALSIVAGSLAGGVTGAIGADGGFLMGLKVAVPNIAGSFAQAGVIALGELVGLDPRLTGLISIGAKAGVTQYFASFSGTVNGVRHNSAPRDERIYGEKIQLANPYDRGMTVFEAIKDSGAISGMVGYAADFIADKLDISDDLKKVLSSTTLALIDAAMDQNSTTTVATVFNNVKGELFEQLAVYAIKKIGDAVGVDKDLTDMAAILAGKFARGKIENKTLTDEFWELLGDFVVAATGRLGDALDLPQELKDFLSSLAGAIDVAITDGDDTTTVYSAVRAHVDDFLRALSKYGLRRLGGALGLDPALTTLAGTTLADFLEAYILGTKSVEQVIWSGLDQFVIYGVSRVSKQWGLSKELTSTLTVVASEIIKTVGGQNGDKTLATVLKEHFPAIVKNAVAYGTDRLAEALGFDEDLRAALRGTAEAVVGGFFGETTPFFTAWKVVEEFIKYGADKLAKAIDPALKKFYEIFEHFPELWELFGEMLNDLMRTGDLQAVLGMYGAFEFRVGDLLGEFSSNSLKGNGLADGWDQGKLDAIRARLTNGETVTKEEWAAALNETLRGRMRLTDYQNAFSDASIMNKLDDDAKALLARAQNVPAAFTESELKQLNRRLLEAYYPEQIRKNHTYQERFIRVLTSYGLDQLSKTIGLDKALGDSVKQVLDQIVGGKSPEAIVWGAVDQFVVWGVKKLSSQLNLPTQVSGVLGKTASAITDALADGPGGKTLESVWSENLPEILKEFSIYGISSLGKALGLDPAQVERIMRDAANAVWKGDSLEDIFWNAMAQFVKSSTLLLSDRLDLPAELKNFLIELAEKIRVAETDSDPNTTFTSVCTANFRTLMKLLGRYGLRVMGDLVGLNPLLVKTVADGFGDWMDGKSLSELFVHAFKNLAVYGLEQLGKLLAEKEWASFSFGTEALNALAGAQLQALIGAHLGKENLFPTIFGLLREGILVPLDSGDSAAEQLSNVLTPLSLNINSAEFEAQVEEYLFSILDAASLEEVLKDGLQSVLTRPLSDASLPDRTAAKELRITDHFSLYFNNAGDLVARKKDGRIEAGAFCVSPDKRFGLLNGTIHANFDSTWMLQAVIQKGALTELSVEKEGVVQIEIKAQDNSRLSFDANFVLQKGCITIQGRARAVVLGGKVLSIAQKLSQMLGGSTGFLNTNVEAGEMTYFLNGIGNTSTTSAPPYADAFRNELASRAGFDLAHIELVPLYLGTDLVTGISQYFHLQQFQSGSITDEQIVINHIREDLDSGILQAEDMINVVAYSGGGQVFLEAIQSANLPVRVNFVAVGAPLFEPTLSSKIESFQFLYGNLDITLPLALLFSPINLSYFFRMMNRNNPFDIEIFQGFEHMAIVDHDYSYFSHDQYTWGTYSGTYIGFLVDHIVGFLT